MKVMKLRKPTSLKMMKMMGMWHLDEPFDDITWVPLFGCHLEIYGNGDTHTKMWMGLWTYMILKTRMRTRMKMKTISTSSQKVIPLSTTEQNQRYLKTKRMIQITVLYISPGKTTST